MKIRYLRTVTYSLLNANLLEQLSQWIAIGFGNFANCGSRWSQISQQHVDREIAELTHLKQSLQFREVRGTS